MPATPTPRQLRYLRALAEQTGTTFSLPRTRVEASRQIDALLKRPLSDRDEIARDRAAVRGGTIDEAA